MFRALRRLAPGRGLGCARSWRALSARAEDGAAVLSRVSPLHVLPRVVREQLAAASTVKTFQVGDIGVASGADPTFVYVLTQGRLHVYDGKSADAPSVGQVEAPALFGERAVLFDRPHNFDKVVDSEVAVLLCVPRADFLAALRGHAAFAQAVARIVRAKHDVLGSFRDFVAAVAQPSENGQAQLPVRVLEPLYRAIGPAIHAGLADRAIDVSAWTYALRRLPANVTSTYKFLLSPTLPPYLLATIARDVHRAHRDEFRWETAGSRSAAQAAVEAWDDAGDGVTVADDTARGAGVPAPSDAAEEASSALAFRATSPTAPGDGPAAAAAGAAPRAPCRPAAPTGRPARAHSAPSMEGGAYGTIAELPGGARHECARPVATAERRRYAWEMGGKTLILLRDESTDLLDFASLLCTHSIESRKLRRRLQSASSFDALQHGVAAVEEAASPAEAEAVTRRVLAALPLSPSEQEGLLRAFPLRTLRHLREVVLHHEDYHVTLDRGRWRVFNADPVELWSHAIRRRVLSALGAECGDDLSAALAGRPVHIVSSNTHSVSNCLSPFVHRRSEAILSHARGIPELADAPFAAEEDRLYAALPSYLAAHPAEAARRRGEEEDSGLSHVTHTRFTGLQVDVIDASRLDPAAMDGGVGPGAGCGHGIVVNMDYAFGQKAEQMMRVLTHVFGRSIRSVNVLGKAGALVGGRGDVLLPTGCLLSRTELHNTDELKAVGNSDVGAADLRRRTGRDVHEGVMLTIPGTMLQNEVLLRFYRGAWGCVGLEMEGAYYAEQVAQAKLLGLVDPDVETRFAYYTSDLPLAEVEARRRRSTGGDADTADAAAAEQQAISLATKMAPWEGIPPLYGITRAFLSRVLQ